jgi:hypothetical protein
MMDANPPDLIRTSYKGPLAKGTSYPVGAELLSRELAGVPQYDSLEIRFHGEKSQGFLLSQSSFPVLRFEYQRSEGSYSTSNSRWSQSRLEPKWKITIYSIPSGNRRVFRDYLAASGWSLIRTWLIDEWPKNGQIGAASLVISACHTENDFKHETKSSILPAKP